MKWCYVDSSFVVASLCGELPTKIIEKTWTSADRFISSYLLEIEVLSAAQREQLNLIEVKKELSKLGFVKSGSLQAEALKVLEFGYSRGADLFHLATALWIRSKHSGLMFLTLDEKQKKLAELIGFECVPMGKSRES